MGWAEKRGDNYRAVWRDARGKKHARSGFAHKLRAERYAAEQENKLERGEPTYVARSQTWGAWWREWNDGGLRGARSASDRGPVGNRLERWVMPRWDDVPLVRIERAQVQRWVNELAEQMAPGSVEKVYYLFAGAVNAAVEYERLGGSPCARIKLPAARPSDERWLEPTEFAAILDHLTQPYRSAAIVLAGTGMRAGELTVLHQHRIDDERGLIRVREAWNGEQIVPYPKGRRLRDIPMPSWVRTALRDVHAPSRSVSCGLPHEERRACRSGLAIPSPRGGRLDMKNFYRRQWTDAVAKAGVDHARMHDLRHTCASWLKQAGRSDAEIGAILGHSEQRTTFRYAHLGTGYLEGVRDSLEQIRI